MNETTYQLIEDLLNGRVGMEDSSFLLSNEQIELNIPRQLVYLAGLCCVGFVYQNEHQQQPQQLQDESISLTTQKETNFVTLQNMFQKLAIEIASNDAATLPLLLPPSMKQLYYLSPRLCTNEQQNIVKKDLQRKVAELECIADEAMRELNTTPMDKDDDDSLEEESVPSMNKRNGKQRSPTVTKRNKQKRRSTAKRKLLQTRQQKVNTDDGVRFICNSTVDNVEDDNSNDDIESDSSADYDGNSTMDATLKVQEGPVNPAPLPWKTNVNSINEDDRENDNHNNNPAISSPWIEIKRKVSDTTSKGRRNPVRGDIVVVPNRSHPNTSQRRTTTPDIQQDTEGDVLSFLTKEQNTVGVVDQDDDLHDGLLAVCIQQQRDATQNELNAIHSTKTDNPDSVVSSVIIPSSKQLTEQQPQPRRVVEYIDCAVGFDQRRNQSTTPATITQSLDHDHQRIRELEELLQMTQSTLQEERIAHARIVQKEKEKHVDIVQALQLRLYISETRLKTYEDALNEHIQSVAANMSSSSSTNHHHHPHHHNDQTMTATPLRESGIGLERRSLGLGGDVQSLPSSSTSSLLLSPSSSTPIRPGRNSTESPPSLNFQGLTTQS
jgi:hypothetical protein